MKQVDFTRMDQGTREEYAFLAQHPIRDSEAVAAGALGLLKQMAGPRFGYQVDRFEHSLQSATRARRDGADEETVVCALLHDIGDVLAPENHSQFAAAMLRPYVSEANHWIVRHHGLFQGYYYYHHLDKDRDARERYRGHPHFEACARFCERWDQMSFDPAYDSLPLEAFEPMVYRLFARDPQIFD